MLKAYLAHSSDDKNYVERVAKLLGRALCVVDSQSFEPGVDFRKSIETGLDKSRLFVFFVSKKSLASTWVKYEIDEAYWRLLKDEMVGAMTIFIEKDIKPSALPPWMQRSLAVFTDSPTHAVRLIRTRLIQESGLDKQLPFIGREKDLKDLSRELIIQPEDKPRRIIIISGLSGVGRRTFVRRALRDYLSLDTGPIVILEETSSLDSLHFHLLSEVMELRPRNEVARELAAFAAMKAAEKGQELARLIAIISRHNVAPIIVDHNSLLDDNGRYSEESIALFEALALYTDAYLVLIHNRRPVMTNLTANCPSIAFHRLAPLSQEDSELLLRQVFRLANIDAKNENLRTLALYAGGYPPTIEMVSTFTRFWGLEALLADKSILTDFQVRTFAPILDKFTFEPHEWDILRLLAGEPILPLEVIQEVICCTPEKCAEALRHLIDLNLVLSMDHQFAISFPVKEAVERLRGHLTEDDYRKIASHLLKVFWKNPNEIPELSVVDATIHAMARCDIKEFEKFQDLILPSQLYRVAKEEYDSKNWDSAIQFAVRTLQLDSARDGARIILCKAYVRKERWDEAEREIRTLAQRGVRARFYCKGFLEWKHGHLELAVDAFRSALDAGDTSISVYRDLAHCLFRSAHIDQAKQVLKKAPERIFHNNYVVDLLVQIAIAERDWPEAERHVSVLEHIATKQDFYYRRSTLKSAGGQWIPALQDIENSLKESTTPRFEIVAQKADILIELGHFPDAAAAIDTMIPSSPVKRDVKSGLKCKLLLRQGKWPEAEIVWAGLGQKSEPVHKVLRKEILILKAADIMASPTEREDASKELALIGEPVQLLLSDVSEDID